MQHSLCVLPFKNESESRKDGDTMVPFLYHSPHLFLAYSW